MKTLFRIVFVAIKVIEGKWKMAKKSELAVLPGNDIYDVQIKKGMKFALIATDKSVCAKKGDTVKVTSVAAMGMPSDGHYNDYEMLRVSNGKYSWRISRDDLTFVK